MQGKNKLEDRDWNVNLSLNQPNNGKWSPEEEELLRRLWPTTSIEEIAKLLGRSPNAVRFKAGPSKPKQQNLGLGPQTKTRAGPHQRWTPEDVDLLDLLNTRLRLPSWATAALLGRTEIAVTLKRYVEGMPPPPRSQKVEHHSRNVPQVNPSTFGTTPV